MIQSDAYHHGDLRAAIIATAITMAEEQGVAALSIRAIARRLGVSHAAPARHFANRSALLAGVAAAAFSLFSDELEKSARGATEEARLSALGVAYVRFALRRPALFRLMFNPEATDAARVDDPALRAAGERAYATLESAVRSLLGDAADADVENATRLAWAGAHGAAMLWLDGPLRELGERGFMRWAKSSMDHLARTLDSGAGPA